MPDLPLTGVGYQYNGRDTRKRLLIAEKNRTVAALVRKTNQIIADNPKEIQVISYASIARAVGCEIEIARHALSERGGHNGITIRVTAEDREALVQYKSPIDSAPLAESPSLE